MTSFSKVIFREAYMSLALVLLTLGVRMGEALLEMLHQVVISHFSSII